MSILNKKDLKILSLLDKNSRISISELARKLKLSKDGVNYRLKKLEKDKIITRYFTDIDVSKLGLNLNKIAFQFQNADKEKEEEIFNFLKKHPKVGWVVFCSGKWDAVMVAYVKDLYEYNILVKEINQKYGRYIHSKEFVAHPEYYVCNRKWLDSKDKKVSRIGGSLQKEKIDGKDIKIIKLLAENSRIPIIEIANKLKISSSLVIKRIKNLEKRKIILNYRVGINLEKIGKEFCKSFIYLQKTSKEKEKQILNYCLNHPNVTAVTFSIGPWDFELEMEVKNFDEFYNIMNKIKNNFKENIRNYEAIVITKEYGIDYSTII